MKIGAPIKLVMAPIGKITPGKMAEDKISLKLKSEAPQNALAGIKNL